MMNKKKENLGGRYRIEETRYGGNSTVYKAVDEKINRTVAIKTPDERILSSEISLNKFVDEAKKLVKLNHKNVVEVLHFYEQGELDRNCHLVMEWMPFTLHDRIKDNKLSYKEKLNIVKQILTGVNYIHQQGIIHADLKPSNVFLSEDNNVVKIGDLGIARYAEEDPTSTTTFKYTAPEHYLIDKPSDLRQDIYSIGLMCYELLAGMQKFKESFCEIYSKEKGKQNTLWLNWHQDKCRKAPPLSSLGVGVDKKTSNIIAKMMEKDLGKRFCDIEEIINCLELTDIQIKPIVLDKSKKQINKILIGSMVLVIIIFAAVWGMQTKSKITDEQVIAVANKAKEAMYLAKTAGAENPVILEMTKGNELYEQGKKSYNNYSNRQAIEYFNNSLKNYITAKELAFKREFKEKITLAENLNKLTDIFGVIDENNKFEYLQANIKNARKQYANSDYENSLKNINSSIKIYKELIKSLPRNYYVGSTSSEIDDAVTLCLRFQKKCNRAWYASEKYRKVEIAPFEIDSHEVTNQQFNEFIKATNYKTDAEKNGFSYQWNGKESVKIKNINWQRLHKKLNTNKNHPVVHISFNDAKQYCNWKGSRLPKESEWEYASRGHNRKVFQWGNEWDASQVKYDLDVRRETLLQYHSSGVPIIYDFTGSVWEWVASDENSEEGFLKGGSYLEKNPANMRLAARRANALNISNNDDGFRCARSISEWPLHL